jgi:integrase
MARTVRDTNLETRAARSRLKVRSEPYWRSIDRGAHLGYYRGTRGGSWIARLYQGGRYHKGDLGRADDGTDADGVHVLSYSQALDGARKWFADKARELGGLPSMTDDSKPCTVRQVMTDYLAWYADHKKGLRQATTAANVHILPVLGDIELAKLRTAEIERWRTALAKAPARVRSGRSQKAPKYRAQPADIHDGKRQRRATANRVMTVLKAALNHAWRAGKVASDEQWRKVKPFHNVDAPVIRYLTEVECVRLVNACPEGFRQMVRAALLSGCRYGELAALRVRDFNPDAGVVTIRTSKGGRARHVVLTDEGREFFAQATAGRSGDEIMFLRSDGKVWRDSHQQRPLRDACKRAKIIPAVSFHILRHTHGSTLAMRGVPLPVIAKQLGHADTRMTEKHYAHLSPNYVAETIRANFPTLGIVENGKVASLHAKNRPG